MLRYMHGAPAGRSVTAKTTAGHHARWIGVFDRVRTCTTPVLSRQPLPDWATKTVFEFLLLLLLHQFQPEASQVQSVVSRRVRLDGLLTGEDLALLLVPHV